MATVATDRKSITLSQVLAFIGAEKRDGKHKCPACLEWRLVVTDKGGTPLVDCKTPGCDKGAAWARIVEAANGNGEQPRDIQKTDKTPWPGLTLADFAQQKGFTPSQVRMFGAYDTNYKGKETAGATLPVVAFPYGEEINGKWVCTAIKLRGGASGQTRWEKGETDKKIMRPYGLCLRWLLHEGSDLVLCEGESDTITVATYGIPALGISGSDNWKTDFAQLAPIRDAERIFIIQEPDSGGAEFLAKVSKDLPAEKVYVVKFPSDGPDPNALHKNCLKAAPHQCPPDDPFLDGKALIEYRGRLLKSGEWNPNAARDLFVKEFDALIANATPLVGGYTLRSLADAEMKDVRWLWPGRVPAGKLTIFAGETGTGKSMVSCSLAAMMTKQKPFPDGPNDNPPMDVLMLFCEDDVEDTVAPRLEAAGADRKHVHEIRIAVTADAGAEERMLAFDKDRARLEMALRDNPGIKMVIVDPISSFIGVNMNKEQEVRSVLEPLAAIAKRTGVAFVLIAHLNKRADVNALNKIMGAVAMQGVTRAAWLFAQDKEAEEEDGELKYLMLYGKVNLGPRRKGLEYKIEEKAVAGLNDPQPYIKWGGTTDKTANDAVGSLGAFGDEKGKKVAEAGDWLKEFLTDSAKPATEIYDAAKARGISERTLDRAKAALKIKSKPVGGVWHWRMPES